MSIEWPARAGAGANYCLVVMRQSLSHGSGEKNQSSAATRPINNWRTQ